MHPDPHSRRDDVLAILKRQEETGEHVSEAQIGRELGLEAAQVSSVLRELTADGRATRTASGAYELTPAAAAAVQPRPHPDEPSYDEPGPPT